MSTPIRPTGNSSGRNHPTCRAQRPAFGVPSADAAASDTTVVLLPPNGATVSGGVWLDAVASSGATSVVFTLSGGNLNDAVIATATPTIYGWLAGWTSTTVPDGAYTLKSVASYAGGLTGSSRAITMAVVNGPANLGDLVNSSFAGTPSSVQNGNGCSYFYMPFEAVYPASARVGYATLDVVGCVETGTSPFPYDFGSFTLTTSFGSVSGDASGSWVAQGGPPSPILLDYQIDLSVTAGTGAFAGTTGNLRFSATVSTATPISFVGSVAVP